MDSELASFGAGRLSIKCLLGHNIRKKGQAAARTKIDAYLEFVCGKHKVAPRQKTQIHKKADSQPNFQGEVVKFDIEKVAKYVLDGDIVMICNIKDDGMFSDAVLGTTDISILQFMSRPNEKVKQRYPLIDPSDKNNNAGSEIELEVSVPHIPCLHTRVCLCRSSFSVDLRT